jgi:neural Wiskott-Aldrich syndrome protein
MSPDPNKKSERAFQCRDILWETFEQMARELECSVDYLINEAMKQYARQRNRVGRTDALPAAGALGAGLPAMNAMNVPAAAPSANVQAPSPPGLTLGNRAGLPMPPLPAAAGGYLPPPPLPPPPVIAPRLGSTMAGTLGGGRAPLPAPSALGARSPLLGGPALGPPSLGVPPSFGVPPSLGVPSSLGAPPPLPAPLPLAAPPVAAPPPQPSTTGRTLVACYMNEQVPITKDRFVIGRGRQSSDLTIKDPNVSRQHAMVEFHNGQYYMVDLSSTNGVEYNGQRVARQLIVDGDTFRICDHEVRFVFA